MGLGRHGGGLGAARFLAGQGVQLTISDAAQSDTLGDTLARLTDFPEIALHLGGHQLEDFTTAELVVVNPAVRPDHPSLSAARKAGVAVTSEIELFLQRCPAHMIGVSGSNGKSTTSTMLFEILQRGGCRTWLGGNIGGSLLGNLDAMKADDWVVLELSSFQLEHLTSEVRLPDIAVLTNCTANHLDWHDGFDNYAAAKQRLLQSERVVLNTYDPTLAAWGSFYSPAMLPLVALESLPPLRVPGAHNRQNAACAATAACAVGIDEIAIREALAHFSGLEHRIQWTGTVDERHFYNDSKSTSPAASIAALDAMDRPAWLLVGGVSKGTEFAELAAHAASRVRGVAIFGEDQQQLRAAFQQAVPHLDVHTSASLEQAFHWCCAESQPGDAILLSPACASFDQYRDYCHRGEHFRELVAAFAQAGRHCSAPGTLL